MVGDRDEDRPVVRNVHARGLQCLVERAGEFVVVADRLARGLHLRRQVRIHAADLGEREGRGFDVPALLLLAVDFGDAQLAERLAQNHLRGDVCHGHARRLGKERHGTRRTRIDLDDIDLVVFVEDELDVIEADDADPQSEFDRIVDDLILGLLADAEGRIDADRIARMDARALHMFHDAGDEDVLAVADGVHLQLLAHDIAVDQHRRILVDLDGRLQVVAQALLVRNDLHGTASEHIARTHQHRVADAGGGLHAGLDVGDGLGLGLRDAQLFHDLFEATAVFGVPDRLRIGTDNGHAQLRQRLGQVDGRLAAQRDDDALGLFEVDDVHHVLDRERLEVELVAARVVRRDGFGVVVDDDGFVARLADRPDRMDGRIVELHALTDADRARPEHDDLLAVAHQRLVLLLVGRVEIGHVGGELRRAGIDHLVDGENPQLLAQGVHLVLGSAPQHPDVLVAEAHALGLAQRRLVEGVRRHRALHLDDVLELLQEEHVDLGVVVDERQVDAVANQLRNGVEAVVGTLLDVGQHLVVRHRVELLVVDVADARLERAHSFEQALLHRAAHRHHLARGFHLRAEFVRRVGELVEGETRHLRHHVVERRLERGGSVGQPDLVERQPHGHLGRNAGDRIAARLRRQRRRARHTGVDLDQVVFERQRVERELHVTTAFDFERTDDFERTVAQHLEFAVGERLARCHHDRIARMDTYRIDVLHATDRDGRIVGVTHHLVFDLLIPLDALFDEHLMHRREDQRVAHQLLQLLAVVGEAAARTAQREGRTQHHRIADPLGGGDALLHVVGDMRRQHRFAQPLAQLLEQLAVFGLLDALERRTQNLDLALLQHALLGQLHGQIQARLAAQPRHDGIGTLVTDDLGHVFERQRLHIDLVGDMRVGHDRRRIGIHQDHLVPLLFQREAGLRPRIVELGGLTDHDRPRADHHYFLDIRSLRHFSNPPSF